MDSKLRKKFQYEAFSSQSFCYFKFNQIGFTIYCQSMIRLVSGFVFMEDRTDNSRMHYFFSKKVFIFSHYFVIILCWFIFFLQEVSLHINLQVKLSLSKYPTPYMQDWWWRKRSLGHDKNKLMQNRKRAYVVFHH